MENTSNITQRLYYKMRDLIKILMYSKNENLKIIIYFFVSGIYVNSITRQTKVANLQDFIFIYENVTSCQVTVNKKI